MRTDIGYGRPPVATRFQKGTSGNPGGRPGPRRALERQFQLALANALLASPEATCKPVSICDWLAQQLVQGAAAGDFAALELIVALLPEKRRRVRVPARIVRALCDSQMSGAHSEGNSGEAGSGGRRKVTTISAQRRREA